MFGKKKNARMRILINPIHNQVVDVFAPLALSIDIL